MPCFNANIYRIILANKNCYLSVVCLHTEEKAHNCLYTFRLVQGLERGSLAAASLRPFHCMHSCLAAIFQKCLCLFSKKESPTQFNFLVLMRSTLKIDNSSMWPTSCTPNNIREMCAWKQLNMCCFISKISLGLYSKWSHRWHKHFSRTGGFLFLIILLYFKLPYQNLWAKHSHISQLQFIVLLNHVIV